MRLLAELFKGLKDVQEKGETLLDRAMVFYGSNLGDANAHSTTNMPVLLAGGGFRHAGHLVFTLAHEPQQTKGKGMLMFFSHLSSGHKGIASAMATEAIPVRATFSKPASSVTVSFWGSTATPALLEAFDAEGNVVGRASLESIPARKGPGDPVPIFTMTVKASRIAYIQFSGPREGEYLAADEVRFTPVDDGQ